MHEHSDPGVQDDLHAQALTGLRALTRRPDATFHQGQFEAIQALVAEQRRVLVVQRTGWGKSAVYFLAALLQRQRGFGPALIVSPLIALMRDQVQAATRAGVKAATISSANATEWEQIEANLAADQVDVLLISPERLVNPSFRDTQLPSLLPRLGLLVIDEAHCISDWGHDFRPDYRRLRDLVRQLEPTVPVLATTATANQRVVADVAEQLGGDDQAEEVLTLRGPLTRESLRLGCLRLPDDRARLEYLAAHLDAFPGSGIIYTLTVPAAQDLADLLNTPERPVRAYTGRTEAEERAALEEDLKENRVKALVATSALGMGFDKPDLGFVIHLGAPNSPVAYYQQVGRAGRATDTADVLLLPGEEDPAIWEYFATSSMPDPADAQAVLTALEEARGPLTTPALEARVDMRRSTLELLLKVIAVDGAVERTREGWKLTGTPWQYEAERYAQVAASRRREQEAMLAYEHLAAGPEHCRMVFLARQLDDETAHPCGRCDNCAAPWFPDPGSSSQAAEAAVNRVLQRVGVPVPARRQWPSGIDHLGVRGTTGARLPSRIPASEQHAEGRVLARMSDLGWSGMLRELLRTDAEGRALDTAMTPAVGDAVVKTLAAWDWDERPAGVVWVPSLTRPMLISQLAQGIAHLGRMQDLGSLDLAPDAPLLQGSRNSAFRVRDLWDRFAVGPELQQHLQQLDGAPVLLVDDRIDSGWTMTVVARLLRLAGSGPVLPFALARTA